MTIKESIHGWAPEDLTNLWFILTGKADAPADKNAFVKVLIWRYYSRPWAEFETLIRNWGKTAEVFLSADDIRDEPSFDHLVHAAARSRGIREDDATLSELGRFISQSVIIDALRRMSTVDRDRFFTSSGTAFELSVGTLSQSQRVGPLIALTGVAVAQISGFGVYQAATTAVGFLTHAVGVTLPFGAYAGLTSVISALIGPVGFLGAGAWLVSRRLKFGPDWNRIVPALLYIFATNARRACERAKEEQTR